MAGDLIATRPRRTARSCLVSFKIVPDTSSSLDDPRERLETISSNHMDMCRFYGPDDPGYRQVAGELRRLTIAQQSKPDQVRNIRIRSTVLTCS